MAATEKILVLKNNTKPITKYITMGKNIQYQLKNDATIYHGQIQQIQSDSLIVNNDAVYFKNLKMLHGKQLMTGITQLIPLLVSAKTYDVEHEWSITSGNRKRSGFFKKSKSDCCE